MGLQWDQNGSWGPQWASGTATVLQRVPETTTNWVLRTTLGPRNNGSWEQEVLGTTIGPRDHDQTPMN